MTIEVIDGSIAIAEIRRANAKVTLYETLTFDLADGQQRTLQNVAVAPAVNEAIFRGANGRFYTYRAIDHSGLMAIRLDDGRAAFAMPSGNERLMLIVAVVGFVSLVAMLASGGSLGILSMPFALGGTFGYHWYRLMRTEGRARFDRDA